MYINYEYVTDARFFDIDIDIDIDLDIDLDIDIDIDLYEGIVIV